HEYTREGSRPFHYEFEQSWKPGEHHLGFELEPLTPDAKQVRSLTIQILSVNVRGPLEKEHWVHPAEYSRFFPKPVPADAQGRREYARELLAKFTTRAFRRPPDSKTLDRLVKLAEAVYTDGGKSFENGIAQAMVAVLASPRFLFRDERIEAT